MILNPWDEAKEIATRLQSTSANLIIVLSAESWCQKCRDIRPVFEIVINSTPSNDVYLWLDIDAHNEFIGDYIPQDLPEIFIYKNKIINQRGILSVDNEKLSIRSSNINMQEGKLPPFWERFTKNDWAVDL